MRIRIKKSYLAGRTDVFRIGTRPGDDEDVREEVGEDEEAVKQEGVGLGILVYVYETLGFGILEDEGVGEFGLRIRDCGLRKSGRRPCFAPNPLCGAAMEGFKPG